MNTYIQNPNAPLYLDYYTASFDRQYFVPQVVGRRGWATGITTLVNKINSKPMLVPATQFIQSYDDVTGVTGQVQAIALSAGNSVATITLANNGNGNQFIKDYFVRDNVTQTTGRVVDANATSIVLLFVSSRTSGVTAFTSADFAVNAVFTQSLLAKGQAFDGKKETGRQIKLPKQRIIQLETMSKTLRLTKGEMQEFNALSVVKETKDGKQFLAYYQQNNFVDDFALGLEEAALYSDQVLEAQGTKQGVAGSLLWQIRNEDGYYSQMSSTPSEADLQEIIEYVRDVKGSDGNIMLMLGTQAQSALEKGLSNKWLTYAGTQNTFGGSSIKGLNFTNYQYLGVNIDMINYNGFNQPFFNNRMSTITGKQWSQSSMLAIDESMVPSKIGQGMLPFASTYCQGSENDTQKGGKYRIIRDGSIDEMGNDLQYPMSTTPSVGFILETTTATVLNDPTRHALKELAS
jgi:hypothetical protein